MTPDRQWVNYLEERQEGFLQEVLDFVRIPSVSALPDHRGDVAAAAEWLAERMRRGGIENVAVLSTGGHPVVTGDWLHAPPDRPTVMIYGHFDVQPVDPLELWTTPPFEPRVAADEGRIYARGASDDKGPLLAALSAVEALLATRGTLPLNVKFFFEGQEEIGSPQLPAFLASQRERFACDLVVSADGLQWTPDQPTLELGIKGLCAVQIDVQGPSGDLHSGLHGGVLQNPIHALARLLASMRGDDGRILVDGFYDDVVELTAGERAHIARVPFDESAYKAHLGVDALFGEPGYTTRERNWARPTLEVNGIWGGFQGEGAKTVIPGTAHAKITCRLVADQEPQKVAATLERHVAAHTPPGVRAVCRILEHGAYPYRMPADHPGNRAAHRVLEELYGREPYYTRSGGSIPVVPLFLRELGCYTVSFGFSLEDEQLHAPNEFVRISSLERCQQAYGRILDALAEELGCGGAGVIRG